MPDQKLHEKYPRTVVGLTEAQAATVNETQEAIQTMLGTKVSRAQAVTMACQAFLTQRASQQAKVAK